MTEPASPTREPAEHPSPATLRSFGEGRLAAEEAAAVEAHLGQCDDCCRLLEESPADSFLAQLRAARELGEITATVTAVDGSTPPSASEELPAELAGHTRYRVLRLLGRGGMGAVYLAEHQHMSRAVALKVIHPHLLRHAGALSRFQQEARAAAQLDHPNIVPAYDADHAGGLHFLVLGYIEGENLADYLARCGPLPVAEACDIARQAALGLQHAHERGMVHRDIKPHNLMRTQSGQVKVLDFGLARLAVEPREAADQPEPATASLTGVGGVVGTADYIAPEQARDAHEADGRADIYSLGCTLYHLLAGVPPFPEGSARDKLRAHAGQEPRPLSELRPDVPEALAAVVARMLAKRPEDRFSTAAEAAAALAPFAPRAPGRSATGWRRWRRRLTGTALAVLVAALTALALVRLFPDPEPGPTVVGNSSSRHFAAAGEESEAQPERPVLINRLRWPDASQGLTVTGLSLSADGRLLALSAGEAGTRVFEVATGKQLAHCAGRVAQFTPNGRRLVTVCGAENGNRVLLMEADTGHVVREVGKQPARSLDVLMLAPDGKTALTSADDRTLHLWDLEKAGPPRDWQPISGQAPQGQITPDGTTVVVGWGGPPLRFQACATGEEVLAYSRLADLRLVTVLPGQRQALVVLEGKLWVVDVATGEPRRPAWMDGLLTSILWSLSRDRRRTACLPGDGSGRVTVYELGRSDPLVSLPLPDGSASAVCLAADGRSVAGASRTGEVAVWRLPDPPTPAREETPAIDVELDRLAVGSVVALGLALSPDGRHVVTGGAGNPVVGGQAAVEGEFDLRLWDLATGKEVRRFVGHTGGIRAIQFTPDGRTLVSAAPGDRTIRLWDVETGRLLHTMTGHTDRIQGVAFSPDGSRLASAGADRSLRIWDVASGRELARLGEEAGCPWNAVVFEPGGKSILAGGYRLLVRYDLTTHREVLRFAGPDGAVAGRFFALDLSSDGRLVLSGGADDADGGVRLWDTSTGRMQRLLGRFTGMVLAVAFTPDGRRAVAAGTDGVVRAWDVATGVEVERFALRSPIVSLAVSPDSRRVLAGVTDRSVRILRLPPPEVRDHPTEIWRMPTAGSRHTLSRFSADGRLYLCDGSDLGMPWVYLGQTPGGALIRTFAGQRAGVFQVPFGLHVLTYGTTDELNVWDLFLPNMQRKLTGHPGGVASADLSPDGRLAASGGARDGKLRLWDISSGQELAALDVPSRDIRVAFSPDGTRLLSWSLTDHQFRLWDPQPPRLLGTFAVEDDLTGLAGFLPNGSLVSYSIPGRTARVWDPAQGREMHRLRLEDDLGGNNSVVVRADGRLITAHRDRTVRVRDLAAGMELARIPLDGPSEPTELDGLSVSSDGCFALVSTPPGTIHCVRLPAPAHPPGPATGQVTMLLGYKDRVTAAVFTPDGRRLVTASGQDDRSIRVWDTESAGEMRLLHGHERAVTALALLPDGRRLLSGDRDGILRLWELDTGKELQRLENKAGINGLAVSPDGRFALVTGEGTPGARVWDLTAGRELRSLEGPPGARDLTGSHAAFSPDGRLAAAAWHDGSVSVWEAATLRELKRLRLSTQPLQAVVFLPDSKGLLAAGDDRLARLVDIDTGEELQRFEGHADGIDTVAVSADGQQVLTGSRDRTLRLWDRETGAERRRYVGNSGAVSQVAFSPDGRHVVSASEDRSARLWRLPDSPPQSKE